MPCFNEAGNIAAVVSELVDRLDDLERDAELIRVDDGSTDETWARIMSRVHGGLTSQGNASLARRHRTTLSVVRTV